MIELGEISVIKPNLSCTIARQYFCRDFEAWFRTPIFYANYLYYGKLPLQLLESPRSQSFLKTTNQGPWSRALWTFGQADGRSYLVLPNVQSAMFFSVFSLNTDEVSAYLNASGLTVIRNSVIVLRY